MGYSKNATIIKGLPLATSVNPTDLILIETLSASQKITFQNFINGVAVVFYGFWVDNNGTLNVDVINTSGEYDASIYSEWFLGGAGISFTVNILGDLEVII